MQESTVTGGESSVTNPPSWSGALLRCSREAQDISIKDLSKTTKVRRGLIEAIETDDFGSLPDRAYLRGLLAQIAKALGLPEDEVSRSYMQRIVQTLK
ncbi:helix-turn-helix transcriptional regulator [Bdellovibrionota bacterium FG-1]